MQHSLFFFCLLLTSGIIAQPLSDWEQQQIDSLVYADIREGSPGLAVGIVRQGEVIYEVYAGLADIENELMIGEETRFNIASNGKQFTALAALHLVQEGKLSLDDDVRTYLQQLYPQYDGTLTVRHLITHSAGLRDVYQLLSLQGMTWWKQSFGNEEVMTLLEQQTAFNFEPGTAHDYSNSNYLVLAEVIAAVTGEPFAEYTQKLYTEWGMPSMAFEPDPGNIVNMAKPYFQWDSWKGYDWIWKAVGDGSLFVNLPDQLRWEAAIQSESHLALSAEFIRASQGMVQGSTVTTYGYGLEFDEYKGEPMTYHEGTTGAWKAVTLRFPDRTTSVVVVTNSGAIFPPHLARDLADVLLDKPRFMRNFQPLGPKTIGQEIPEEEWLGTYQIDSYYYHYVRRDGQLWLERPDRSPVAIEQEMGSLYQEVDDPAFKQHFTRNVEGVLQITSYYHRQTPYTLTRVEGAPSDVDLAEWAGCFTNAETEVEVCLQVSDEEGLQVAWGEDTYSVQQYVTDELVVDNYVLDAKRGNSGEIEGFWLAANRLGRVLFERID